MTFKTFTPDQLAVKDLHQFILGIVSPRPIAFVSTLDHKGIPNLAPYSFFNAFSSNPPIVVFSSNRRVKDNSTKDTLHNIQAGSELVINAVSYDIMHQMALASIEYPPEVDEFAKAGLTALPSEIVRPPRVAESPAHLECRVQEIITLGDKGGAGHLIICHVLRIHIRDSVLDQEMRIDPHKIDLVGRMGRAFYIRASGEAIHTLFQPMEVIGMGFDQLPAGIRNSPVLTGNELAAIAALPRFPDEAMIERLSAQKAVTELLQKKKSSYHELARQYILSDKVEEAAAILLLGERCDNESA